MTTKKKVFTKMKKEFMNTKGIKKKDNKGRKRKSKLQLCTMTMKTKKVEVVGISSSIECTNSSSSSIRSNANSNSRKKIISTNNLKASKAPLSAVAVSRWIS